MDQNAVTAAIRQFQTALNTQNIHIDTLILYGSQANGTAHKDSDIDLIVVAHDFAQMDYWQRIDVLSQAIRQTSSRIEPVAFSTAEWQQSHSLLKELAKDGRVIHTAAIN